MEKWENLPIINGEDGVEYNNLCARFSHLGCPGMEYEDNCAEYWDCATKGRCRINYERIYEREM